MATNSTRCETPQHLVGLVELLGDKRAVRRADGIEERERDHFAPQVSQVDRPSVLVHELEGRGRGIGEFRVAVDRLCEGGVGNGVRGRGDHRGRPEQDDPDGANRGETAKGVGRPRGEAAPPAE